MTQGCCCEYQYFEATELACMKTGQRCTLCYEDDREAPERNVPIRLVVALSRIGFVGKDSARERLGISVDWDLIGNRSH